ncbi:mitochondrial fission ELM1 family protein [Acidisphaera sp. L21]|uniref:mitochondrial fission ELM1 family protein n=1 Tax=Acidisphaera sp. L21 TaxID=1641851 RepID=UPI00131E713C|nr:mitochondrial fission ELM1 family protein [Acidisphaera sp. L21]
MRDPAALRHRGGPSQDETAPVWVLDDPYDRVSDQAIGIAERLGVPHLRVPLAWRWNARMVGLSQRGSLRGLLAPGWPFSAPQGPALAISASPRSEAVALWLRQGFGTRLVHCGLPRWRGKHFDLLVMPRHLRRQTGPNVLPVLGEPHRLSPLALSQARVSWAGRLSHLPRPLITLLVGGGNLGGEMRPAAAHALARQVARMAAAAGGSILATTSPRTGQEATDALAGGLASSMHVLYRWGEPGENPYAGMIALSDITIVTGDSPAMISEACSGEAPVFIASLGDRPSHRRLHELLYQAGQARPLGQTLTLWPRSPLDEAGRVATEIRARMSMGPQAVD